MNNSVVWATAQEEFFWSLFKQQADVKMFAAVDMYDKAMCCFKSKQL